MKFTVTVASSQDSFEASSDQTILESGLKAGINLSYSCKNGKCAACKNKILSGNFRLDDAYDPKILTDSEIDNGYTLLCKSYANSDIVLDIPFIEQVTPARMMPSKVNSITKVGKCAILELKLPSNIPFKFMSGQYVEVILDGATRSYSIANSAISKPGLIDLHVRYHESGVFSSLVWNKLQIGDMLRFRGPLGSFYFRHNNVKTVVMLCTGTGFAPLKAILDDICMMEIKPTVYLYWGNRTIEDFYALEYISTVKQKVDLHIKFCVSDSASSNNEYYDGYVTEALKSDFADLSNMNVYACGNPSMIQDAFAISTQDLHLSAECFYSDAFTIG